MRHAWETKEQMAQQAFAGARGARVFLSSLPGKARPGQGDRAEEEADRETYERDRHLRAHLEVSLAPLCILGQMTLWHDGQVSGGRWEQEIAAHLQAAQIILLLLSLQFLASSFCLVQMQQAFSWQDAGVRVIPVYLRPIPGWEDFPLSELPPLPAHGRPICQAPDEEGAWYEVATGLRALFIELGYRPVGSASRPPRRWMLRSPIAIWCSGIRLCLSLRRWWRRFASVWPGRGMSRR